MSEEHSIDYSYMEFQAKDSMPSIRLYEGKNIDSEIGYDDRDPLHRIWIGCYCYDKTDDKKDKNSWKALVATLNLTVGILDRNKDDFFHYITEDGFVRCDELVNTCRIIEWNDETQPGIGDCYYEGTNVLVNIEEIKTAQVNTHDILKTVLRRLPNLIEILFGLSHGNYHGIILLDEDNIRTRIYWDDDEKSKILKEVGMERVPENKTMYIASFDSIWRQAEETKSSVIETLFL